MADKMTEDLNSIMKEVRRNRRKTLIQLKVDGQFVSEVDDYAAANHITRASAVRELTMIGHAMWKNSQSVHQGPTLDSESGSDR